MIVDLRSDTLTIPDKEMLRAMTMAPVGDDVFDEDPTVKELESFAASLFGKEAGIYCPSGTMTNQIAVKVHTQPQDEIICHEQSHIYLYEGGGIAFNSGVSVRPVAGNHGILSVADIVEALNPPAIYLAASKLVSIENTHNRGGGSCYRLATMKEISECCKQYNLKLHLDGARIFNAIVAMGYSALEVGQCCDTVSVCLSKGLGAPVGSLLLGSAADIGKAKRVRKVFGGGMRQAGFIAAAGLYALQHNIQNLKADHARARLIGEALQQTAYTESVMPVETNIVIYKLKDDINLENHLKHLLDMGIKAAQFGKQSVRMVTYNGIDDHMVKYAVDVIKNMPVA